MRAKRTLDRLAVLSAPRARVVRDGEVREIAVAEVVLDTPPVNAMTSDDFRLLAIMYACLVLLIFFMHRTRTERVERQGPAGDRAVAAVPAE